MSESNRRIDRLRDARRTNRPALGGWISSSDPAMAEVMAGAGYDWLLIDMEHCPLTIENARAALLAIQATPTAAVVRPLHNDPDLIKQLLDLGADGVFVPQVHTPELAAAAVRAAKYAPLGTRSVGPVRASRYLSDPDYFATANERHTLIVQIESKTALENMESILQVEGIDGVWFGNADFSQTVGLLGQPRHETVLEAERRFYELARSAGMMAGSHAPTLEALQTYLSWGCRLPTFGGDLWFVIQHAKGTVEDARRAFPATP